MAKIKVEGDYCSFWCPGCGDWHTVSANIGKWTWNGDVEKPTFSPSVLIQSGHFAPHYSEATGGCWCKYNAEQISKGEQPVRFKCARCHTFVREGRIEYLSDCSHELAGQTVDLADVEEAA